MNLGSRGCRELRSCHCTPARATEHNSVSKKEMKIKKKRQKITDTGKDAEKGEPSDTVGGSVNTASMKKSMEVSQLKIALPYD